MGPFFRLFAGMGFMREREREREKKIERERVRLTGRSVDVTDAGRMPYTLGGSNSTGC